MTRYRYLSVLVLASLALAMSTANAANPPPANGTTMPAWEQLSPVQRDVLVAPIRQRWDSNPDQRARFYQHAQRWQQMTPEQRARAHDGMRRWEQMPPEKREQMRALFQKMRTMTPEQRKALRDQWHEMTPGQRKAWMQANPPAADRP